MSRVRPEVFDSLCRAVAAKVKIRELTSLGGCCLVMLGGSTLFSERSIRVARVVWCKLGGGNHSKLQVAASSLVFLRCVGAAASMKACLLRRSL